MATLVQDLRLKIYIHFPFFLVFICFAHLIHFDLIDLIAANAGYNYEVPQYAIFSCYRLFILIHPNILNIRNSKARSIHVPPSM
jgi:hypothetical protein